MISHCAHFCVCHSPYLSPGLVTSSSLDFPLYIPFPIQGHTLLARHSGSDTALLHSLLTQHSGAPSTSTSAPLATSSADPAAPPAATAPAARQRTEEEITARCKELMNKHKVVLFMKGNPSAPKCGFSRQTIGLLREKGIEFAWFDILSDEDVRQGLKKVNDWPSESSSVMLDTRDVR